MASINIGLEKRRKKVPKSCKMLTVSFPCLKCKIFLTWLSNSRFHYIPQFSAANPINWKREMVMYTIIYLLCNSSYNIPCALICLTCRWTCWPFSCGDRSRTCWWTSSIYRYLAINHKKSIRQLITTLNIHSCTTRVDNGANALEVNPMH